MLENLTATLDSWTLAAVWLLAVLISTALLLWDIRQHNSQTMGLMRVVWILTVVYAGPLGLWVYWFSGRRQIPRDSVWRRGWRSVAHCYSGCGAGEIIGVLVTLGLLGLSTWPVAITTFLLAYTFGYALTVGPLMQEGVPLKQALWDAFTSETASITVMELVAIGVGLWLAGSAGLGDPLFWTALVVSLMSGLLAAWPVNVLLIRLGVKAGMHDPREMAEHPRH